MPFSFLIPAGASLLGGLLGSDATQSAANTTADATREGVAEQRRQYDQNRTDTAPYRAAGETALGQFATDINKPTTSADVMADPGYQFALQQGQQALDRRASASGGRISGASLKAASQFAQGQATTGFNAAYRESHAIAIGRVFRCGRVPGTRSVDGLRLEPRASCGGARARRGD